MTVPSPLPRGRLARRLISILALLAVAGNAVVAAHAWRFTHFVAAGTKTSNPEEMGVAARLGVLLTGVVVPRPTVRRQPADVGLVAEAALVDGVSTWTIRGTGRGTALLFHGYGGAKSDLLDEAAVLNGDGWTTVLVDFPGSGDSAGDTTTLGWHEADVVASLARAQTPSAPLLLFGKSMGSAAVLRAVGTLGVTADALVLENPFDRLVTTVGHRFEALGLPARPGADLLVFWGGLELGFDGFAMNPVVFAADVHTPTLLLHGAEDPRVFPEEIEAIADAIPAPHEVMLFPGAGHMGLYAADAGRWTAAVRTFLAKFVP